MLFFTPLMSMVFINVAAAVIPAIFLLRKIYRLDTIEKEPGSLLKGCLISGVFAVIASIILELIGQTILDFTVDSDSPYYTVLLAFLVVAVVEEGTKLFFLKKRTWNHPAFDYLFDGIVYAAFVSLGFAALENIHYVFSYGLSVAFSRAIFSIPGHFSFSVFMGFYYGRAKLAEADGYEAGKKRNLFLAFLIPVLLHGFYDACAMSGSDISMVIFLVFVVLMYIIVYRLVKRSSQEDTPIYRNWF